MVWIWVATFKQADETEHIDLILFYLAKVTLAVENVGEAATRIRHVATCLMLSSQHFCPILTSVVVIMFFLT